MPIGDIFKPKSKEEILKILKEKGLDEKVLNLLNENEEAYNSFLEKSIDKDCISLLIFLFEYFNIELKEECK